MKLSRQPGMLLIMDGFGLSQNKYGNAIASAKKPNLDRLFKEFPHTELNASGEAVGLPDGQMGNSEVGHLNIGSGRIVYQDLTRITKSIESGSFFENPILLSAAKNTIDKNSTLHLMGLLSDGGVHSHINHLIALLKLAKKQGVSKVKIHCFLDGRDVPPKCAIKYIEELESAIDKIGVGEIADISGRYYAMDRDNRWNRIEKAYNAVVCTKGRTFNSAKEAIEFAYQKGESDEFVIPSCITTSSASGISDNDSIVMFNFRPDRARQITRAIVDPDFENFKRMRVLKNLKFVCMTEYAADMPNVEIAYPPENIKNTLGEYIASLGFNQLRIAETEKYAHVTFFFNGGVEKPNQNEDRILIPSPKVATYNLKPEMSAFEVKDKVITCIKEERYDFIILNFANCDMVGHTGDMEATIKAVEAVDSCVGEIADAILEVDGNLLITADHGNADVMLDKAGNTVTAHSLNKVPLIYVANTTKPFISAGSLCDIAPTLLKIMGLEIPPEMTGNTII